MILYPETEATQYKTIHELVTKYEEQHGQMSLNKWNELFQQLGYLNDFLGTIEQFKRQHSSQSKSFYIVVSLCGFIDALPSLSFITSFFHYPQTFPTNYPQNFPY